MGLYSLFYMQVSESEINVTSNLQNDVILIHAIACAAYKCRMDYRTLYHSYHPLYEWYFSQRNNQLPQGTVSDPPPPPPPPPPHTHTHTHTHTHSTAPSSSTQIVTIWYNWKSHKQKTIIETKAKMIIKSTTPVLIKSRISWIHTYATLYWKKYLKQVALREHKPPLRQVERAWNSLARCEIV